MSHGFVFSREAGLLAEYIGWKQAALTELISAAFATCAGRDPEEVDGYPDWCVRMTDCGVIRYDEAESYLETIIIEPREDALPGIVASRLGWRIHYVRPTRVVSLTVTEAVVLLRDLVKSVGPGGRLPDDHEIHRSVLVTRAALRDAQATLQRGGLLVHDSRGWSATRAPNGKELAE